MQLDNEKPNPNFHVLDRLRLDLAKEDRVKAIHSTKDRRRTAMGENIWCSSFFKAFLSASLTYPSVIHAD